MCDHSFAMAAWIVALLLSTLAGCAAQGLPPGSSAPTTAEQVPPAASAVAAPPTWRPGDRWVYSWTSGSESGTKTIETLEVREINEVPFYLVRVGDVEVFYTRDLGWAGTMQDGRVTSRMTPPQPWFTWPLRTGQSWTHRGVYEDRTGKTDFNDVFSVAGRETVDVPAGRFNALKIVRQTERRDSDEYWYAPDVRFYVKWIGRRGDTAFEEQLQAYHPAPRLIPEQPPTRSPSTR